MKSLDDEMMEQESEFKSCYVDQILASRDLLFGEMCDVVKAGVYTDLRWVRLNTKNTTKDQLCRWLETACCLLDSYAAPVLQEAQSCIDQLTKERIADQQRVSDLQEKLIDK